jgi:iron complex transport system substrate-binding protein
MREAGIALALLALAGCAPAPPPASGVPARVVSLAPSLTEIVYALGAGGRLVGVCAQCDHPPDVARVPRVGGYLVPSVEAVVHARPDLVVTVPSPGNREAVLALERTGVRILVVEDRTLADLWATIRALAAALDVAEAGERLVADVRGRLDALRARVAARPVRRVLVVIDHHPLVAVGRGTLQDELVTMMGGTNVAADAGAFWPPISVELVVARAPEVIVDAGMSGNGAARDLFGGLGSIPAVRDGRIVALTDDGFFRAGPRLPEAAAALGAAIHPEAF